eukprot:2712231-Rhodomonas_salina.1
MAGCSAGQGPEHTRLADNGLGGDSRGVGCCEKDQRCDLGLGTDGPEDTRPGRISSANGREAQEPKAEKGDEVGRGNQGLGFGCLVILDGGVVWRRGQRMTGSTL